MPKTRNVLRDFRFETSIGVRSCDVNKDHKINPGEKHLAYEVIEGMRKNICMQCAPLILERANAHLQSLRDEFK
jgi:hypothetical protein